MTTMTIIIIIIIIPYIIGQDVCDMSVCVCAWSQSYYNESKTILNHYDEFEPSILSSAVPTKNEMFIRTNRWQTCKFYHRWSLYRSEGLRSAFWDQRILTFHLEFLTSTIASPCVHVRCEAKNLIKKVIKIIAENVSEKTAMIDVSFEAAREGIVIAKTYFYEKCGAHIWHAWK